MTDTDTQKAHGSFAKGSDSLNYVPGEKAAAPELITRSKEMTYVSLHHHSTFSFLDGYGLPEAHARRAAELGMAGLALTEHGNVSSHVGLEQAATKVGVKPIFGCELYTGHIDPERRTQRKNHLTVLAETDEGYRNLLRLVSKGWDEGFYYEPTVSGKLLRAHRQGLVILSGCQGSLLATSLVGGKNVDPADASYARAKRVAAAYKRELGSAYYLEVQAFPELENCCTINQAYEQLSNELGIPLVATGDVHYTRPEESEMQQILHNVRGGGKQTLEEQARNWSYDVPLSPPTSDSSMYRRLRATGLSHKGALGAIKNSQEIFERCSVTLPKAATLAYPLPEGFTTADEVFVAWLKDGWAYRKIDDKRDRTQYVKALRKEMRVIQEKNFIDYFLVVSDLVRYAKDRGIPVGPGRGSAAASLVCYLLRITEVDPLLFPNLVFERFIDITRADLPDIDLDFDGERRVELRAYAAEKYGDACVGSIGSFTEYKSKNSLDDISRVFHIPQYETDKVKNVLIQRSSGDLRASATIADTVDYFDEARDVMERFPNLMRAIDLEGQYKGVGVHAAGLVVSSRPLNEVVATYTREVGKNKEKHSVVSTNKYDSEYLGILKIDILGLNTMRVIGHVLAAVGLTLEDLYGLPLDNEKVIDGFRSNDVVGIFQFDGRAMRSVNAELQPDNFKEICDVNALARPGPLHSEATAEYIDTKRGRKEARRIHPLLDPICKDTHYQVVYQEQILRIVREIGNFDWTHAAYIRKIISRKIGEQEFQRQYERFREGALANGLTEKQAYDIWQMCITAGSYAFNLAHCIAYGMIAYWCMYLKLYYPEEFYAAALTEYGDKKQFELLRDATKHGLKIYPPDPASSSINWTVRRGGILAGLAQISGIGEKTATQIQAAREPSWTWHDIQKVKGIGAATVAKCVEFCASDDPFEIHRLERLLAEAKAAIRKGQFGRLPLPTHTGEEIPYNRGKDVEVVWIGELTQRNLKDLFEVSLSKKGEVLDPDTVRNPELREWVNGIGRDDSDELVTLVWDRWKYPRFKSDIWAVRPDHDLLLVRGVKKGFQSRRAIYVSQMWTIDPDD